MQGFSYTAGRARNLLNPVQRPKALGRHREYAIVFSGFVIEIPVFTMVKKSILNPWIPANFLNLTIMQHWELSLFFAIIAFVYASVGFGGGSSYIAVLALYALPFKEIRLIALLCNIIVVSGGVYIYWRHRQIDWRKVVPLVGLSIPLAYLGATVRLSEEIFFIILGCSLLIAAVLLWLKTDSGAPAEARPARAHDLLKQGAIGGGIGFLSGMVGIGGGIFLAPALNLMRWDFPQKIAATASVFILVNSIAGLIGQWMTASPGQMNYPMVACLCAAVFLGGQSGSRMSVSFNPLVVRRVTAFLVFVAGTEVLVKHLPKMM